MPFGWTRTAFGLVYFSDTTQDGALGVNKGQSKIDADCGTSKANDALTAATLEATYETDRTSVTGADANLQVVVSGPVIPLTGSNPGVV